MLPERESRPTSTKVEPASVSTAISTGASVGRATVTMVDLDAWAETHRGRFVVEVGIADGTRTRTFWYANVRAAQRCVDRAKARGHHARVALVQTLPVAVLQGLG